MAAQYGVRNPRQRSRDMSAPGTTAQIEFTNPQFCISMTRNVAATEVRKRKSATPGAPIGNIENIRCTIARVLSGAGRKQSRLDDVGLSFRISHHTPGTHCREGIFGIGWQSGTLGPYRGASKALSF
jgi:hypothetical protein